MKRRRCKDSQNLVAHFAALAEAIAKESRLEAILRAFNQHLAGIIAYDRASISVLQGDQQFSWHLVKGRPEAEISRTTSPRKGSIVECVIESGRPVIVPDLCQEDTNDPEIQEIMRLGARSCIFYPLAFGGQMVGVMDVEKNQVAAYSDADLPLIRLVANQVALALGKGKVFQDQEQRIKDAGEQLVQAGKLATVGQLAAVLAHELKNRFNVIQLGVQSLAALLPEQEPDVRLLLESVQRSIVRGQALMQDLLRFARPHGSLHERVNLKLLAEDILSLVRQANVQVVTSWQEPVPPISGSEAQLAQVLVNLIINGLDAMPEGGTLSVTGEREGNQLVVRLADTGVGMSPDVQAHLFELFFTTKKGGTGLGLPISRTIVEQAGGHMQIASEVGQGTTVTLRFPVAEDDRQAA